MRNKNQPPNKLLRILFLVLIVLIGALIILGQQSGFFTSVWDKQTRFNVVAISKSNALSLWSYSPLKDSFIVLNIPDNLYLQAVDNKGKIKANKLYALGELDKRGGELVHYSIQNNFGIIIDGYIHENLQKTNLKLQDLWQFYLLKNTKKKEVLNLPQTEELVLADGEKVQILSLDIIDKFINNHFYDQKLEEGDTKISIINGTGIEGVGGQLGRILNNVGLNVTYIGNSDHYLSQSNIQTPNYNLAVKKLMSLLHLNKYSINNDSPDIIIEIGTEYLPYQ